MGRLIDADICLNKAWQNFYKQEDEHEKNIDGYDIMRDRFYEQSGFECCQQTIVNAPTVEAIPKADYETRLKADMVAMLTEIQLEIEELNMHGSIQLQSYRQKTGRYRQGFERAQNLSTKIIQQKIDSLREVEE